MGSAKATAPILIWRGLENPEVNFAFRLTALDGGQTKKEGRSNQLRPCVLPIVIRQAFIFFHPIKKVVHCVIVLDPSISMWKQQSIRKG